MAAANNPPTIDDLKKRYDSLEKARIRAETNLENARKQLEQLKGQAREQFGTDDIEKLRAMLDQMTAENESKRAAYQHHIEEIESKLQAIDSEPGDQGSEG